MKIATWNVNSLRVRLPAVCDWLARETPDVVALQETKVEDGAFPREALVSLGYHVLCSGQKTYNGVALLSRGALTDPDTTLLPGDPARRFLAATLGTTRLINVYVPNGAVVGSDKYQYKLTWLNALEARLRDEIARHREVLVLGDFNIAPADCDVHDPAAWTGSVLVSGPEREAFARLLGLGLTDLFRAGSREPGFTWWDYRLNGFRRNLGLRIDHLLGSVALARRRLACTVDVGPRGGDRPSDHAPVMASFAPSGE